MFFKILKCFLVSLCVGREARCDELRSEWHEEDDFLRQLQELHGTGARLLGETKESDLMESWKPCRSQMFQMKIWQELFAHHDWQLHLLNMFLFWNQMLEYAVVINWIVACLAATSHPVSQIYFSYHVCPCMRLCAFEDTPVVAPLISMDVELEAIVAFKEWRVRGENRRRKWKSGMKVGCRWISFQISIGGKSK